jgi:hypothetical protein
MEVVSAYDTPTIPEVGAILDEQTWLRRNKDAVGRLGNVVLHWAGGLQLPSEIRLSIVQAKWGLKAGRPKVNRNNRPVCRTARCYAQHRDTKQEKKIDRGRSKRECACFQ